MLYIAHPLFVIALQLECGRQRFLVEDDVVRQQAGRERINRQHVQKLSGVLPVSLDNQVLLQCNLLAFLLASSDLANFAPVVPQPLRARGYQIVLTTKPLCVWNHF
jgi:hypothetical protein